MAFIYPAKNDAGILAVKFMSVITVVALGVIVSRSEFRGREAKITDVRATWRYIGCTHMPHARPGL
jgi:hypothetical protein